METLKNYFALVFPTLFYTEGIPGTIIDAYAAGLPVISSKWESYDDVIEDNITGVGYEFGSDDALVEILEMDKGQILKNNRYERCLLTEGKRFPRQRLSWVVSYKSFSKE